MSQRFDKLVTLLRELFQLDQPDVASHVIPPPLSRVGPMRSSVASGRLPDSTVSGSKREPGRQTEQVIAPLLRVFSLA